MSNDSASVPPPARASTDTAAHPVAHGAAGAAAHSATKPIVGRSLSDLPDPLALIFDLDGTLVDTVHLRIEAWIRAFAGIGLKVEPGRLAGYMGSDGRWLAGEIGRASGRALDWAATDELDRASGAIFDELNVAPVPLPDTTELLTALEGSRRVTFAIATSSQPGQVAVSVRALQLPVPPPITDGGHVEHAKPEPDLLLASAAQLGVAPGRCWYVGDATWDMMAAVRAGMVAIGVTTGASDAGTLYAAGAAVSIAGLGELLAELRDRSLVA
jgi:HAD superfamily hydrolase (TIGR01509 family)